MSNPLSKKNLKKLKQAIESSFDDLRPFREVSYDTIQQYCGSRYGRSKEMKSKTIPINLIQLATEIYVQNIAPVCPRYLVKPKRGGLKQGAGSLELALNHISKELKLKEVYTEAVTNAMFSMGIVKVGTAAMDKGTLIDATQPYAESVSMNDWVHDTTAKKFSQVAFCGDRIYLDIEDFKDSGLYKHTDKVSKFAYAENDQSNPAELGGDTRRANEYREVVELWEIFLPAENLVVTIPAQGEPYPVRVIDWSGSEVGPYHLLKFTDVPDNIMPVAPASSWRDIHTMVNDSLIKAKNQSARQKSVLAFTAMAKDDAKRIKNSNDGDTVGVSNVDQMKEISFGGADPNNLAMIHTGRDLFNWSTGNLDALGGLSANADTLGQEKMIGANSSKRLVKMKQRFADFSQSVGEGLGDELWYDPDINMPMVKRYPTGIEIEKTFNADAKEGDYLDYNVDIDPYSMSHTSPAEKLASIYQILQQFLLPLMAQIEQQGGSINMQELVGMVSRYSDNPELAQIIVFAGQGMRQENQPIEIPGTSGDGGTTEHIRTSVSTGGSRSQKDSQMASAYLGQNTQPNEQAASLRMGA